MNEIRIDARPPEQQVAALRLRVAALERALLRTIHCDGCDRVPLMPDAHRLYGLLAPHWYCMPCAQERGYGPADEVQP